MARKSIRKKTRSEKPKRIRNVRTVAETDADRLYYVESIRDLLNNRPGLIGFLLSLLQLLGHTTWILLVWYLAVTDQTKALNSDSWISWGIVGLLGGSLILTFAAMFVCLYYGLRRPPRALAVIGFGLSFFVGILASTILFMQGIRAMSGE